MPEGSEFQGTVTGSCWGEKGGWSWQGPIKGKKMDVQRPRR